MREDEQQYYRASSPVPDNKEPPSYMAAAAASANVMILWGIYMYKYISIQQRPFIINVLWTSSAAAASVILSDVPPYCHFYYNFSLLLTHQMA